MRGLVPAALLCAALLPVQPAFKSGVELVTVPVAVTSAARDQLITAGLEAGDFRIFEDDEPQVIASLAHQRRPVSICAVVDASGSMDLAGRHGRGVRALESTVRGLERDDELSVVRFAGAARVTLPWTRGTDPRRVSWRLEPGAGTVANSSITDAVRVALEQLDHASNPHRVILVISDGYENTSAMSLSRLATTRQQSEAALYAFGVAGPQERAPGGGPLMNILPPLVGDTGGVYWNVASTTDADFAALSLLNDLKYEYVLAYSPVKPFDGRYRRIRVETTVTGLAVRHRGGYLAQPSHQE